MHVHKTDMPRHKYRGESPRKDTCLRSQPTHTATRTSVHTFLLLCDNNINYYLIQNMVPSCKTAKIFLYNAARIDAHTEMLYKQTARFLLHACARLIYLTCHTTTFIGDPNKSTTFRITTIDTNDDPPALPHTQKKKTRQNMR